MPTEYFLASSSGTPSAQTTNNSAQLRDASIFCHSFQPTSELSVVCKKSSTGRNCLAFDRTSIFAAQKDKAVLHVYNRAQGSHTANIPFGERIHSIAAVGQDGGILALGTESGSVMLWEAATGRIASTPKSHMQKVDIVCSDLEGNFVLSGSKDPTVLVWSVTDLLGFRSLNSLPDAEVDLVKPRQALQGHNGSITCLRTGHSLTKSNVALSASEDSTVRVWNYVSGELLRTYLLFAVPLCLDIDPVDRGFYAGYEDGSVQMIDFYLPSSEHDLVPIRANSATQTATQISREQNRRETITEEERASAESPASVLSLSLSHEGTQLLSGHANGKILVHDTSNLAVSNLTSGFQILATYGPQCPIDNLLFLPVYELLPQLHNDPAQIIAHDYVKPTLAGQTDGSRKRRRGDLTAGHSLRGCCMRTLKVRRQEATPFDNPSDMVLTDGSSTVQSDFDVELTGSSFTESSLQDCIDEIAQLSSKFSGGTSRQKSLENGHKLKYPHSSTNHDTTAFDDAEDFTAFEPMTDQETARQLEESQKLLKEENERLKKLLKASFGKIERLTEQTEESERRAREKSQKRQKRAEAGEWRAARVLPDGTRVVASRDPSVKLKHTVVANGEEEPGYIESSSVEEDLELDND